jgi:G3E family GTPase
MAVLLNKTDLLGPEQIQELQDWYLSNCRAEKVRGNRRK